MTPAASVRWLDAARDLLAVAAGISLTLAFAPFELVWLAFLCPALMIHLWRVSSPRRAALRGFLFGLGLFGSGVSWVFASIHQFGGAGAAEGWFLTSLLVVYLAAFPALAGYGTARWTATGGDPLRFAVASACGWAAADWLRGWLFTGFPWLQLGYSQVDGYLGTGFGAAGGVHLSGLATALIAAAAAVCADPRWPPRGRLRVLAMAAAVAVLGAGLARWDWTSVAGDGIEVALLQGNIPQQLKWRPELQKSTLDRYGELTRSSWGAQVIVWPETAVPAYYHQVRDGFLRDLGSEATYRGADLLLGMPVLDERSGRSYNALVAVGSSPGMYFKRHMVPFGEYLPFRRLFGFILQFLQIPMANFERGDERQQPLRAGGHPLAASICYEDAFGHESRAGLAEAAYLVNVTNDAWFGLTPEPHQHLQMARMRAVESGRFLLRATNNGITAIVGPHGDVVAAAPQFAQAVLRGRIEPMYGMTPYGRCGDWILAAVLGTGWIWLWWTRRGSPGVRREGRRG